MTGGDYELPHPTGVGDCYAPHCDSGILHAPGSCEYCDLYPAWQHYRTVARIAFTGQEPTDDMVSCPSEIRRGLASLYAWGGNTPK
jgi:hypothetical protein